MIWCSTSGHLIESKSKITEQNSLFLNFTPEVQHNKKKDSKSSAPYRVNGVNILNRLRKIMNEFSYIYQTFLSKQKKPRHQDNHREKSKAQRES